MILRFKQKSKKTSGYFLQLEINTKNNTFKSGYFIFNATAIELTATNFKKLLNELKENNFKEV